MYSPGRTMSNTDTQISSTVIGQAPLPQAAFVREQSSASPEAKCSNPSTGPRTEAGKAVSARNAVKHNLCSKRLTGTDLDELNAIRAKLDDEWEPSTETERMLLDQMALSQWRMDRALSLELHAFDDPTSIRLFSPSRSATAPPPSAASIKLWPNYRTAATGWC